MTLSSTEAEYVAFSAYTQEVNFVITLLEEMTEVQKPSIIYEENQGAIFLVKNNRVGICTKHIDIHNNFLQDMVEDKDVDIHYICSEEKPCRNNSKKHLGRRFCKAHEKNHRGRTLGARGYQKGECKEY